MELCPQRFGASGIKSLLRLLLGTTRKFLLRLFIFIVFCLLIMIYSEYTMRLGHSQPMTGKSIKTTHDIATAAGGVLSSYCVGVLTSYKYLSSRAIDCHMTWAGTIQNLYFYVGEAQDVAGFKMENLPSLPLKTLKGVKDNVYPPREKSFRLLQHWCENSLGSYDWFIKTDDDVYVKTVHLERFLKKLDPGEKFYIGRAEIGGGFERRQLDLYGNMYCSGATVIYSKRLLQDLCPHLNACIRNHSTAHEDTEVGRCVMFNTGLQCTDIYNNHHKMAHLFFHSNNQNFYSGDLNKTNQFDRAITLHNIKNSLLLYRVHNYYMRSLSDADVSTLFQNLTVIQPVAVFK